MAPDPNATLAQKASRVAPVVLILLLLAVGVCVHITICVIDPPHPEAFAWPVSGVLIAMVPALFTAVWLGAVFRARQRSWPLLRVPAVFVAGFSLLVLPYTLYAQAAAGCGAAPWATRSTELPLRHLIGLAVADDGRVFVGLHGPNRIQVYGPDGRFRFGWLVSSDDTFTMKAQDDRLLLHDWGGRRLHAYALDGTLLESREVPTDYVLIHEEADDSVVDPAGATLSIDRPHLIPRIVRTTADGSRSTFIENPWRKWGWIGALPVLPLVATQMIGLVAVGCLAYGKTPRQGAESDPKGTPAASAERTERRGA